MEKRRKPGRPTKLDAHRQARILKLVRQGNYLEVAARASGIDPTTLHDWVARGRAGEPDFAQFSQSLKAAEGEAEAIAIGRIRLASKKHWQAAAWMAERKNPSRWGQRVKMTIESELNELIGRLEARLPRDVFEQVLDAVAGGDAAAASGEEAVGGSAGEEP